MANKLRYTTGHVTVADKAKGVDHVGLVNGALPKDFTGSRKPANWSYDWRQRMALKKPRKYKDVFVPLTGYLANPNIRSV
jgi:hypothetical protein